MDLPRLRFEYKKLRELDADSDLIRVKPRRFVDEDTPVEYEVHYYCLSLYKDHKQKKILVADAKSDNNPHIMSIVLPAEYPAFRPELTFKTRIFHPNINDPTAPPENFESIRPGAVCVAAWKPSRSLRSIALEVGEMIQYKRYGMLEEGKFDILPTPVCKEALKHLQKNLDKMPIDSRNLTEKLKIELEEKIELEPEVEIVRIGDKGTGTVETGRLEEPTITEIVDILEENVPTTDENKKDRPKIVSVESLE